MITNAAAEARARRAARRVGYVARKSRWRRNSLDNFGEFQLIDPERNFIVAGERFDMTPDQVIEWCDEGGEGCPPGEADVHFRDARADGKAAR